jgi:hypothetical protein
MRLFTTNNAELNYVQEMQGKPVVDHLIDHLGQYYLELVESCSNPDINVFLQQSVDWSPSRAAEAPGLFRDAEAAVSTLPPGIRKTLVASRLLMDEKEHLQQMCQCFVELRDVHNDSVFLLSWILAPNSNFPHIPFRNNLWTTDCDTIQFSFTDGKRGREVFERMFGITEYSWKHFREKAQCSYSYGPPPTGAMLDNMAAVAVLQKSMDGESFAPTKRTGLPHGQIEELCKSTMNRAEQLSYFFKSSNRPEAQNFTEIGFCLRHRVELEPTAAAGLADVPTTS